MRRRFEQLFLMAAVAAILVSVLLPSTTIGWMRHNWLWFTLPLDWIEGTQSPVNLVHLILFLLLGAAMRVALRSWPLWLVAVSLALLGIGTELAQLAVPGRHPRLADILVDIVAGIVGWTIARWVVR